MPERDDRGTANRAVGHRLAGGGEPQDLARVRPEMSASRGESAVVPTYSAPSGPTRMRGARPSTGRPSTNTAGSPRIPPTSRKRTTRPTRAPPASRATKLTYTCRVAAKSGATARLQPSPASVAAPVNSRAGASSRTPASAIRTRPRRSAISSRPSGSRASAEGRSRPEATVSITYGVPSGPRTSVGRDPDGGAAASDASPEETEPATVTTSGADRALSRTTPSHVTRVTSSSVRWPGWRAGSGDEQAAF